MTKVETSYRLERPLDEALMAAVARAHGVYGLLRVRPAPTLEAVEVEYDASRLTLPEVEAALRRAGLPLARGAV